MRCVAAALLLAAACNRGAPARHPATEAPVLHLDDAAALPLLHQVAVAIAFDPEAPERVSLAVAFHGIGEVSLALPAQPDQLEWFDPRAKALQATSPRIVWSAWHRGSGALVTDGRPSTSQRAANVVTVRPGEVQSASVDLAAALVALAPTLAAGWCARAWLIGGAVAIASNVVCSPTNRPEISRSPWR